MPLTRAQKQNWGAVAVFLVGLGIFCSVVWPSDRKPVARAVAPTPGVPEKAQTDEDVLFAATKDLAKYSAGLIVKNSRLAPSQTEIVERELIETRENYALAYIVVDTPNPYGVRLRKGYCVVLHFTPPRGRSYEWNRTAGVVGCDGPPDEETAWAVKLANQWPGIAYDPVPFGVEEKSKAARSKRTRR